MPAMNLMMNAMQHASAAVPAAVPIWRKITVPSPLASYPTTYGSAYGVSYDGKYVMQVVDVSPYAKIWAINATTTATAQTLSTAVGAIGNGALSDDGTYMVYRTGTVMYLYKRTGTAYARIQTITGLTAYDPSNNSVSATTGNKFLIVNNSCLQLYTISADVLSVTATSATISGLQSAILSPLGNYAACNLNALTGPQEFYSIPSMAFISSISGAVTSGSWSQDERYFIGGSYYYTPFGLKIFKRSTVDNTFSKITTLGGSESFSPQFVQNGTYIYSESYNATHQYWKMTATDTWELQTLPAVFPQAATRFTSMANRGDGTTLVLEDSSTYFHIYVFR